jgi:TolA-binding protein
MGKALSGMTGQAEATRRLDDLMARPEVKEQVVKAEREANAMGALDAARKLRDAGNDLSAYERFRAVSMDYPETPAAGDALIALRAYDDDAIFQRKRRDSIAAPKAEPLMKLADNYRRGRRPDLARQKLQEVIDRFPDTTFADTAKKQLDELPASS